MEYRVCIVFGKFVIATYAKHKIDRCTKKAKNVRFCCKYRMLPKRFR